MGERPRRRPTRAPPLKACKNCGALIPKNAEICPHCMSKDFSEAWEGMIIVIDPGASVVARELGVDKQIIKAIIVAGRIVA